MEIQPYLMFNGHSDEAAAFYGQALGAKVTMRVTFNDSPEGMIPEGMGDKVMHMRLQVGEAVILASDGQCSGNPGFQGFSLSLTVSTEAEAEHVFRTLAEGGQVRMPLAKTFFSPRFGMLTDRFGVSWMIYMAS